MGGEQRPHDQQRDAAARDGLAHGLHRTLTGATAAALFAALTLAAPASAWGRQIAAQLDYVAAPGCPVAADFEAVVAGRLGYSPFRPRAPERVVVRIEASGHTLEGRLEWRNETGAWAGERMFPSRSGDCGELARAMGFALALQFQLLTSADPAAPPAPEPPPPVVPPVAPPSPPPPAPPGPPAVIREPDAPSAGRPPGPSLAAGAGAAAVVGLSPSAMVLGRVLGGAAWSRVALEVSAEVSLPSTTRASNGSGFSQQVLLAGVAGCGLRGRLSGCVLAKGGQIRVTGEGVTFPATDAGWLVHAGVGVAVSQLLGRYVVLVAHADGLAALTRAIVNLNGAPVWTTPRLGAALGIDLGIRFR